MSEEKFQMCSTLLVSQLEQWNINTNYNYNAVPKFLDLKEEIVISDDDSDDMFFEGECLRNNNKMSLRPEIDESNNNISDLPPFVGDNKSLIKVELTEEEVLECVNSLQIQSNGVVKTEEKETNSEAMGVIKTEDIDLNYDEEELIRNVFLNKPSVVNNEESISHEKDSREDSLECTTVMDAEATKFPEEESRTVTNEKENSYKEMREKGAQDLATGIAKLCSLARLHAVGHKERKKEELPLVRWLVQKIQAHGKPIPEWIEFLLEAMLEQIKDTAIEDLRRAADVTSRMRDMKRQPLMMCCGLLMHEDDSGIRLFISKQSRLKILKLVHGEDHLQPEQLIKLLESWIFWPNWKNHVTDIVKDCHRCQAISAGVPSLHPWEAIMVTAIRDLNVCRRGNNTLMVAVDLYSGFFEVEARRGFHESRLAYFIQMEVEARWVSPKYVLLDSGLGNLLEKLQELTGLYIKVCTDDLQLPSTIQPFRAFETCIRTLNRDWSTKLPAMLWDARNTVVPLANKTPKQLLTKMENTTCLEAEKPRRD